MCQLAHPRDAQGQFVDTQKIHALDDSRGCFLRYDFACQESGKPIILPPVIKRKLFAGRQRAGLCCDFCQVNR